MAIEKRLKKLKQRKMDALYMDIADRVAKQSQAVRAQVGAVIVRNDNIISFGWNGTPAGLDNTCEIETPTGELVTKPEVIHAEANSLMKLAAHGGVGADGATLYVTLSPCPECAKLIKQAKIKRVVFRHTYRVPTGLDMLKQLGIKCKQLKD